MLKYITVFLFLLFPFIVSAQHDSTYCAQKFKKSSSPVHPPSYYFPEIEGGFESIYKNITYPDSAAKSGIEGKVYVWFLVTDRGKPECFKIVESPHPILSKAVIKGLKLVNYKPAIANGKPIERSLSFPINFKIPEN